MTKTESDARIEYIDRLHRERRERELNPDMESSENSKANTKMREEILDKRDVLSMCQFTTVRCAGRILKASRRMEANFSDGDGRVLENLSRQTQRLLMALEKCLDKEGTLKDIKEMEEDILMNPDE